MRKRLRRWLNDIPLDDPIARQQALLLQVMLVGMIVIFGTAATISLIAPFTLDNIALGQSLSSALYNGLAALCCAVPLVVIRLGRWVLAVSIIVGGFLVLEAALLAGEGFFNGSLLLCAFPLMLAALLLGRRGQFLTFGLSLALVGGAAVVRRRSSPDLDATAIMVNFALIGGLILVFLDRFGISLRDALASARVREQQIEQSRAALQGHAADLEREIAERRRVEAALRESEERYRLITENSIDLISLVDLSAGGQRVYVSPSYTTLLGYQADDITGPLQFDLIHPDDREFVRKEYARLVETGACRVTYRTRHTDGSWHWIELQATAIWQQGRHYAVTVGRDISEQKRIEAQLMQAQRMESVGQLAGGIAHDFNNLLTAIIGNTELALDSLPQDHPARADIGETARAAARAAELTRQLLAFARKQIIEPRVVDLNRLTLDMDALLRRLIGEDIELITRLAPDLGSARADPGQIEQVIVNLAVNARDAMPSGGKITIETQNVALDQGYAREHFDIVPGPYIMIAVSDTGIGMDEQTRDRAFEPFFTTKERGRGTGLGLAMCYGIVKQHGGSIWAYSEPDQGSTFKIYLPRVDAQAEQTSPADKASALPRGHETILLVEDEPAVRGLAVRVLREQGYTVLEASNGDEALAIVRARNAGTIDLLLTDVIMPAMGGKELAQALHDTHPSLRVLFISGYADNAIAHQGRLDPGVSFLPKPFSPATLARKVRDILDTSPTGLTQ